VTEIIADSSKVSNLPGSETRSAEEMTTRFNSNVFIVLSTDLAELKRRPHFTVEFILLLRHLNVILRSVVHQVTEIGVYTFTIWIQVTVKTEGSSGKILIHMTSRSF